MDTRDSKRKKDRNHDDDSQKRRKSRSPHQEEKRGNESKRKRNHSPDRPYNKQREEPLSKSGKRDSPKRKANDTDMLNTRTGGAYIPPARLRMMQAQITDKSSIAYQRLAWEALKKSIHGHINKINVGNIGIIIKELLKENIVRGRGLLCRSIIQAQAASLTFTNVYAALVAAVNSRFPNIGELLLKRLVIQFKRGFKRNDKPTCISSASFIAHLVNQRVAHEILALELLTLLVESPTDDSVEVSIAFLKECGQKLTEVSSKGVNAIFEMLRNILHEGQLDKRVQYMIEVMFQVWKDGFKDHPALIEELELVPEEEQFTHLLMLDDATDPQDILNVFKFDEKYEENEQKYKTLSKDILGSDAESGDEEGSTESGSEESDEDEEEEEKKGDMTIIDKTETNLVALRRTIYLTINSSLDFEECAHKLLKMQLKPGQEVELCHMFLDCCAEQRTYEKFYGLLAQRFCNINRMYIGPFEDIFKDSYSTAHRLDTNRLRNVSKFFAHLLFTDSISWEVLSCVKLNEEDTTSSSRIYIKILFQELAEYMGMKKLNDRLQDPTLQEAFQGIFPRDNPKNTRFAINFFTSIGLGGLTDELREHLKQMPKNVPPPITEIQVDSESSSSSSSSEDSSDSSSSDSEEESNKKKSDKKQSKSSPKEPIEEQASKDKEKERWGHSGFYEVYGKHSRNNGSKSNDERDEDNFVRPNDRRDRRTRQLQRNGDDRSNRGDRYDSERDYRSRDGRSSREMSGSRRDNYESGDGQETRRKEKNRDDRGRYRDESGDGQGSRRKRDDRGRHRDESGDGQQTRKKEKIRDNDRGRDRDESGGGKETRRKEKNRDNDRGRDRDESSDDQETRRKGKNRDNDRGRDRDVSGDGQETHRKRDDRGKDKDESSDDQETRRKGKNRDNDRGRDRDESGDGQETHRKRDDRGKDRDESGDGHETRRKEKNRDNDRGRDRDESGDDQETRRKGKNRDNDRGRDRDESGDGQEIRRKEKNKYNDRGERYEKTESGYSKHSKEDISRSRKDKEEDRSSRRHKETAISNDRSEIRDKTTRETTPSIEPRSYYNNSYYTIRYDKERDNIKTTRDDSKEKYEEESKHNRQTEQFKKRGHQRDDEHDKNESGSDSSQEESVDRKHKRDKKKKKSHKKKKESSDGWDIKSRKQLLKI